DTGPRRRGNHHKPGAESALERYRGSRDRHPGAEKIEFDVGAGFMPARPGQTVPADRVLGLVNTRFRGTRASTVVPCCGFESIESCPFTSLNRSFMLVRPKPRPLSTSSGLKPIPESCTVNSMSSVLPVSETLKSLEPLCLVAF